MKDKINHIITPTADLKYRCMTKCELATLAGDCYSTLQNWCNRQYSCELKKLVYCKNQRIVLPPQDRFLFERLVIFEE